MATSLAQPRRALHSPNPGAFAGGGDLYFALPYHLEASAGGAAGAVIAEVNSDFPSDTEMAHAQLRWRFVHKSVFYLTGSILFGAGHFSGVSFFVPAQWFAFGETRLMATVEFRHWGLDFGAAGAFSSLQTRDYNSWQTGGQSLAGVIGANFPAINRLVFFFSFSLGATVTANVSSTPIATMNTGIAWAINFHRN